MAYFSRHDKLSKNEKEQIFTGQSSICGFCLHSCYVVELGQDTAHFEACLLLPEREQEVLDCSLFEHHSNTSNILVEEEND